MSKRRGEKRKNRPQRPSRQTGQTPDASPTGKDKRLTVICTAITVFVFGYLTIRYASDFVSPTDPQTTEIKIEEQAGQSERRPSPEYAQFRAPAYARSHSFNNETVLVWGGDHQFTEGLHKNAGVSNIGRSDYAGTESCRSCHTEKYEAWQDPSHRWMNVVADQESVKGDFSGSEIRALRFGRGGERLISLQKAAFG